jgi:hypothetical protein
LTVEANGHTAAFVNQMPFNLPASMRGSLTFSSSIPVSVAALQSFTNERGDFVATLLPVGSVGVGLSGTSIVFPYFVNGGGSITQVVLTNPTNTPLAGTVEFFDPGSPATGASALTMTVNGVTDSTFSYAVAPRSIARLVMSSPATGIQTGSVVATAGFNSVVPEGLSISSFSNQGSTVSEVAFPAVSTGTFFQAYIEVSGTLRSGLAIANPSDSLTQTAFGLTALDGTPMGLTARVDIPAHGQVVKYIDELFPAVPNGFKGMLQLTPTQPVAVIGLQMGTNQRGDLFVTSVPVMH